MCATFLLSQNTWTSSHTEIEQDDGERKWKEKEQKEQNGFFTRGEEMDGDEERVSDFLVGGCHSGKKWMKEEENVLLC